VVEYGKAKANGMPGHLSAWVPVTIHKVPLNIMNCHLSQFKKDTGEASVSVQEINPITYLP